MLDQKFHIKILTHKYKIEGNNCKATFYIRKQENVFLRDQYAFIFNTFILFVFLQNTLKKITK